MPGKLTHKLATTTLYSYHDAPASVPPKAPLRLLKH